MTLEHQVASLELSRRLKELGVKQKSHFYWASRNDGKKIPWGLGMVISYSYEECFEPIKYDVSAFTVAELGEMLPETIISNNSSWNAWLVTGKIEGRWDVSYSVGAAKPEIRFEAVTEADARAKMLIHLIEIGVVKP